MPPFVVNLLVALIIKAIEWYWAKKNPEQAKDFSVKLDEARALERATGDMSLLEELARVVRRPEA